MSSNYTETPIQDSFASKVVQKDNYLINIILFILTFITTTFAGAAWITGNPSPTEIEVILEGLPYSISLMFIISAHEFGHYFAAKFHKVKTTLPYYIPIPSIAGMLNFGTLGAVIKTKTQVHTKKAMFDIGVYGPIAGFVACLIVLVYGFMNLPSVDYILNIHPDFFDKEYGANAIQLEFGDTILFWFLRNILTSPSDFIPPMSEIYHYPYLCVGWFGLFITAMNMIPVGQLDGGHISYTLFGENFHYKLAIFSFLVLFTLGMIGFVEIFLFPIFGIGWSGWLLWAIILYFIIKLKHPPIYDYEPLDKKRKITGYFSFFIFLISFSPSPFIVSII